MGRGWRVCKVTCTSAAGVPTRTEGRKLKFQPEDVAIVEFIKI